MANQSKLQNKDDSYEEHTDSYEGDDSEEKERIDDHKGKGKAVMKEDSSDDSEDVSEISLEKRRIDYKRKGKAVMKKDSICLTKDSETDMLEGSRFEAEEVYLDDFSDRERAWASDILDFKDQVGRPMWVLWDEQFRDWYVRFERGIKADSSLSECKETMDPSPEIKIELRDYQKEWLHWAVKQEESKFKGGILADEIGMGKTVEAISLVVTRRSLGPSEVRSTLVICPEECLTQWESEIAKCTVEDSIRVLVYHRANETRHSKECSEYDFVLTTYDTVMDEFRKRQEPLEKDTPNIYSVKWKRIILDEAHYLKSTSTKTAMYISALESEYRWALTAQIDGEGLYAMIHFLQVHPYSFFLCENCDGQFLYRNSGDCRETLKCNHGKKRRFCWWNKHVSTAIRLHHNEYLGQQARAMLKHKILKDILLRRKRRKDGTLPPKFVIKNTFYDLDSDEHQSYKNVAEANQANTFVDLTKLQKEVDHPCLLSEENVMPEKIKTSTKIEALSEEIFDMIQKNGSAQGVVFSQFPEFLDLIRYFLDKSGITCVQLLANMTKEEKSEAVEDFTRIVEEPKDFKRILLVSITAGVRPSALDLTAASYVFLMEPCWNPFTELQAHELVHRIGQYQPVRVVRFIIQDTIEEKIVASHEKRLAAIDWLTGEDDGSKVDAAALKLLFDKRGTL